ncbi:MAG: tRNA-intron lyase [Candidatus Micrarchaeia archaeon]
MQEIILKNNKIFSKGREINANEALFLMELQNAKCVEQKEKIKKEISIFELIKKKKINLQEYFFYRDARLRGFKVFEEEEKEGKKGIKVKQIKRMEEVEIKTKKIKKEMNPFEGIFLKDSLVTLVKDESIAKKIYRNYWFGQYATYKQPKIGKLNKLDIFETLFLLEKKKLKLNLKKEEILNLANKKIKNFLLLYQIFKDWRGNSFVLKTGFKFGCDFRIYPSTSPNKNVHSKYVLHLLPKEKTKVSEISRAIRVAHSVRKKFILAIPKAKSIKTKTFFLKKEKNNFLAIYFFEQGEMDFRRLLFLIKKAKELNARPILAIVDRETSVTYYTLRKIKLRSKNFDYFEIDWIKP